MSSMEKIWLKNYRASRTNIFILARDTLFKVLPYGESINLVTTGTITNVGVVDNVYDCRFEQNYIQFNRYVDMLSD